MCSYTCDCASLAVSMSEAVSMSVCANECVLCVIRGMEEGLKERTHSRDSVGTRRRMWGSCAGERKRPVRWWMSNGVCLWFGWVYCGCVCVSEECEKDRQLEKEPVFFRRSSFVHFLILAQPLGLKEAVKFWIFHDFYVSPMEKFRSNTCSFAVMTGRVSSGCFTSCPQVSCPDH